MAVHQNPARNLEHVEFIKAAVSAWDKIGPLIPSTAILCNHLLKLPLKSLILIVEDRWEVYKQRWYINHILQPNHI